MRGDRTVKHAAIVLLVLLLSAPAFAEPSPDSLLKARILQLEMQLSEAVRRINLLQAQLSEAQQKTIAEDYQKKVAEAEKEAGCALDWNTNPPFCKPEPKPTK